MLFNVEVVSESDYDTYIDSLRAAGNDGQLGLEYERNQNLPGTSAPTEQEGN